MKDKEGTIIEKDISEDGEESIISVEKGLAKITIVGNKMYSNTNYIEKIYEIANKQKICIYMISISEIAINIIVQEEKIQEFAKALHLELIEKLHKD